MLERLLPHLRLRGHLHYDGKSHWCTEQLKRRINGAKPFPLPDSRGEQLPVSGRNAGKGGCKSNLRSIVHCC